MHWTGKTAESETDCHFSELDLNMPEYQSGWVAKSMDGPSPAGRRSSFRTDRGTPTFVRQPTRESVGGETLNTLKDQWKYSYLGQIKFRGCPNRKKTTPTVCRRRVQRAGKGVGCFGGVSYE